MHTVPAWQFEFKKKASTYRKYFERYFSVCQNWVPIVPEWILQALVSTLSWCHLILGEITPTNWKETNITTTKAMVFVWCSMMMMWFTCIYVLFDDDVVLPLQNGDSSVKETIDNFIYNQRKENEKIRNWWYLQRFWEYVHDCLLVTLTIGLSKIIYKRMRSQGGVQNLW